MHATANPLHKPKPARDRWLLHGRFYFTDENGRLLHSFGTQVCLTAEDLWVAPELSIPVGRIESLEIVARRGVPPRRFLRIAYVNPITMAREEVFLCKPDPIGIGLYRVKPLQELVRRIEALPRQLDGSTTARVEAGVAASQATALLDRCEVCGAKPAYYVGYLFLVSAVLLYYRSAVRRRLHCRKHNAIHGLGHYCLTVATGWIGIGIVLYPFVVFAAGRNLAPALGKAGVVLGALPTLVLAALAARWLL